MSNTNLTIDMITREALRIAHEKATFIGTIDRQYDSQFAKEGGKIGSTLRIREPIQGTRRKGSRVMDVKDQTETYQNLTVATQDGFDMRFNSAELAMDLDDFSQRYIEPHVSVLMSGIDGDCIVQATKDTYNTAGSAGTVPGASADMTALTGARAKLNQGLAPKDGRRYVQLDSIVMGSVVNGLKSLFHEGRQLVEAFREGFISRNAMADWYENERTWSITNTDDVSGSTDASALVTDGGSTIDMHTLIAIAKQQVGEVFTVAGVYACHPETKAAYPHLQQFVITALGATVTTISPTIYLTGPKQNVCKSDGTQLATTDFNAQVVTPWGSASTTYKQNLMYHKEAYTFVTADLPLMADAAECVRRTKDGISMRIWKGSDIRNDELLLRGDILWGFKTIRPAWACRISS